METHSSYVRIRDTKFYFEKAGNGTSVVFIHGFSLDTRIWDDQFEVFARDYCVVRYDLRGFGKSAINSGQPYSHVYDLEALLGFWEIGKPILIGHSLGGRIAIDFALTFPDRIRGLILVDTALTGFRRTVKPNIKGRGFTPEMAKQVWIADPLFASIHEKPFVRDRLSRIIADYSGWHWMNQDPGQDIAPPAIERINEIKLPTLIMVGQKDLNDFHVIADLLNRQISQSEKFTLRGVGHIPNMEDPLQFNWASLNFLSRSATANFVDP
jgi:pimeloyl-ACP methyl ester carboxylesterase